MGGPVRVGLCRDSAPSNSTPMRRVGGAETGICILLKLFIIFINCYINMLKGAF